MVPSRLGGELFTGLLPSVRSVLKFEGAVVINSDRKPIGQKYIFNKKFRKSFYFLLVFYLIMCLMKAQMNFGKIAISKIWELISLGGVKTHFGKLVLEWCIFRHVIAYDSIRAGHTKHLKMIVWTSVLWKIFM